MIETFVIASAAVLFWKLVGLGIETMRYRNNRD